MASILRFTRRPFRAAVAPDLHVAVPTHDAVLAQLRQSVENGVAITLLEGDPGSGKSLLALRHLMILSQQWSPVYLPNAAYQSSSDLHAAVLHDLGKDECGWPTLSDALFAARRTNLVLDDADSMSDATLADLRRFSNLVVAGEPVVSILLVGSSTLAERVKAIGSLAGRVGRAVTVPPLPEAESITYLHGQAKLAGQADLFTDEAVELIAAHAGGSPRTLNQIAAEAMGLAEEGIDAEVVLEALARLAEPAESSHAAGSKAIASQPRAARTPKEKARKRNAA